MKVELKPGESVDITFEGTDGVITVTFGKHDLKVEADLPDTAGREGVIYFESFALDEEAKELQSKGESDSGYSELFQYLANPKKQD